MVIDKIQNAQQYYGLGPRFQKALEWLKTADATKLTPGQKVEIEGSDIYATYAEAETVPPAQAKLEAHQNYADIQYLVSGVETVGYILEGPVQPKEDYNPQKDVQFFTGEQDVLTVQPGTFYIVWPQDYHAPKRALDQPVHVQRIVVKVKL